MGKVSFESLVMKKKKGEEAIEVKKPKNKTVSKNQKTNQPINQTPKDTI